MNTSAKERQPVALAQMPAKVWRENVKIRFSHCDPAGIVYFANYFDIANSVVEDWFLGELGFEYREFIRDRKTGLGFAGVQCDFFKPSTIGDVVTFAVLVENIGNASVKLKLLAYLGETPILAMRLVMVTTSLIEHRAIPVPNDLRKALETYKEKCQ